mgnify:CR=1 FL=1
MPEKLRTAHLETLKCPALIVQGERDPFGSPDDVRKASEQAGGAHPTIVGVPGAHSFNRASAGKVVAAVARFLV